MRILTSALIALAALFATPAQALDVPQRLALHTDIQADPVLSQLPPSSDSVNQIIATYAAAPAVPCTVWKSRLTPAESRAALISASTQVNGLSAANRDTLFYFVSADLNPTDPNVRAGLDDAAGSQNALKAALQAAQKRNANRLEKLFSVGACTTASPSTMIVEGGLTYQDVLLTMGW